MGEVLLRVQVAIVASQHFALKGDKMEEEMRPTAENFWLREHNRNQEAMLDIAQKMFPQAKDIQEARSLLLKWFAEQTKEPCE